MSRTSVVNVMLTYLWTMCSFILIRYETFGGVTITEASYSSSNLLEPFIYYVNTFSDIFKPLFPFLSIRAVQKVSKNSNFPTHKYKCNVIICRDWLPKFEIGLNFIIKSALFSIFWQYWITNDLNNSFQCFRTSFFLLNHSNQYKLLFWFRIQVFDRNFQWIQTF